MKKFTAADLFCGAGGATTGIINAAHNRGYADKDMDIVVVNHDEDAISTQRLNHPEIRHFCTGVDSVNPREVFPGEDRLTLLWGSPECTHHSNARGGKPRSDQSRATAWCLIRWIDAKRPSIVIVENVKEFEDWGPLDANGDPIKGREGEIFQAWVGVFRSLNYTVEWRKICAADHGDPTSRERLFVVGRFGKKRPVFPEPTHRSPDLVSDLFNNYKPWRVTNEIIDWSVQGKSIFIRKRALAENTLRRLLMGLIRFGGEGFVLGQHSGSMPRPVASQPCPTVTTVSRISLTTANIVVVNHGDGDARRVLPTDIPLPTVATKNGFGLSTPMIVKLRGSGKGHIASAAKLTDEPLSTVSAGGTHHGLAMPFVMATDQQGSNGDCCKGIDEPLSTVVTKQRHALIAGHIVEFYTKSDGAAIDEPLPTISTRARFGLAIPKGIDKPDHVQGLSFVKVNDGSGRGFVALDSIAQHFVDNVGDFVTISHDLPDGFTKVLTDLLFRMLMARELALAQGFPPGYQFVAKSKKTGKQSNQKIVWQIGNANPCNLTAAITEANLAALNSGR